MLVLVANLGSTSFKYRLFRMDGAVAEVVAKGGYERVTDYATVIGDAIETLRRDGVIATQIANAATQDALSKRPRPS